MKKKATTAAIIIGTALSVSLPVYGAQWKQDSTGWWYEQDNGSYPAGGWELISGNWYYFNGSGYMQTGWIESNGEWYYCIFRKNCASVPEERSAIPLQTEQSSAG